MNNHSGIKQLGVCANGRATFVDFDDTHVTFHLLETPNLLELIEEVLPTITPNGAEYIVECNLGRIIGTTTLVETDSSDTIVYAKRKGRDIPSRFVKDRLATPTDHIVIVLRRSGEHYSLWTAMCGRLLPPEWYDPDSHFSQTHALVYDESLIQLPSINTT